MIDLNGYLPVKRKHTPSGWISFNCPCCMEKRSRGGVKINDQGWSYHCFNCGFTASFIIGRTLSYKARQLLTKLGVPEHDIEMINLKSLKHRSINGILNSKQKMFAELSDISFEEFDDLPPYSEAVTPEHSTQWEYIKRRGVPDDFPVLTVIHNDGVNWTRPQVIIPFTYDNKVVGWTARFLDDKTPKYINHTQPGYVFGTDLQHASWQQVIVAEGIFDALSINGLAVMHNTISDSQARLIHSLDKEIIVVPDQDKAGIELIDRAVELGWAVSLPSWPSDVKDINDAVQKFGKTATLLSILEAKETSKIKIEIRKKNLVRQLQK
jgi:predicted RNA-binding Zn-ribbon protein involved in translation (DUF1610 family)